MEEKRYQKYYKIESVKDLFKGSLQENDECRI